MLKGLKPGTLVVTDHLQSLRQNLKVEPRVGDEVSAVRDTPAQGEARHRNPVRPRRSHTPPSSRGARASGL
ncbi:MAG: hypothetical protein PGN25_00845 [Methylorubrum populi]